ncbi:MAG: flagellar export protein FliJ [Planctomycetota bacterium]
MISRADRLRRLLQLRRRVERRAAEALARAIATREETARSLQAASTERSELEKGLRQGLSPGVLNLATVAMLHIEMAMRESRLRQLGDELQERLRDEERARQNYLVARRDAASFEKLLERRLLEQRREALREEANQVDEAARRAFVEHSRKSADRKEEAPAARSDRE